MKLIPDRKSRKKNIQVSLNLCYLQKIFLICGKYSKPTKTSKMNFFAKVIDELQSLTILVKTPS